MSIRVYAHIHTHAHTYVYTHVYAHVYARMPIRMSIHMSTRMTLGQVAAEESSFIGGLKKQGIEVCVDVSYGHVCRHVY